jgi:hypoxanthine phosphoribosyltransferase
VNNSITIHDLNFELCLSKAHIQSRVQALAQEIYADYQHKKPIFVVVLKGAFFFAADLLKAYPGPCQIDFVQISSYQATQSSGHISQTLSPSLALRDQDIIIIEDIVDTGLSLAFLKKSLAAYQPKSIQSVSLLAKTQNLSPSQQPNYLGFAIPNQFVVGYGLDYQQEGRNLPQIYQLKTSDLK